MPANESSSGQTPDDSPQDSTRTDEASSPESHSLYAADTADEIAASDQTERLAGGGLRMDLRPGLKSFLLPLLIGGVCAVVGIFMLWKLGMGGGDLSVKDTFVILAAGIPSAGFGIAIFLKGIKLFFTFLKSFNKTLTIREGGLEVRSGWWGGTRIPCSHLLDAGCELEHATGGNFESTTYEMTLYGFDPKAKAAPPEGIEEDMLHTLRSTALQESEPSPHPREAPHSRVEPYVTELCTLTGIGDANAARWVLETADRQARSH